MSAADHFALADKLIDAARLPWLLAKARVPGRQPVALDIGERPAIELDDELIHVGMIEIARDQLILFVRFAPPAHHLRRREPALDHRQIVARHGSEGVRRHGWPLGKVSMVTL